MRTIEIEFIEELVLVIDDEKSDFIASINIDDIEISAIGKKVYRKGRLNSLFINKVQVTDHSVGETINFNNVEAAEEYLTSVGLDINFTYAVNSAVDEYLFYEI